MEQKRKSWFDLKHQHWDFCTLERMDELQEDHHRLSQEKQRGNYNAELTEVPAAAKTVGISSRAKERKHFTTAGSN